MSTTTRGEVSQTYQLKPQPHYPPKPVRAFQWLDTAMPIPEWAQPSIAECQNHSDGERFLLVWERNFLTGEPDDYDVAKRGDWVVEIPFGRGPMVLSNEDFCRSYAVDSKI